MVFTKMFSNALKACGSLFSAKEHKTSDPAAQSVLARLDTSLFAVYLIVVFDVLGTSLTWSVMPFYVESLNGSAEDLGIVYAMTAAGTILSNLWMGYVSDRIGRRSVLLVSVASTCTGFLLTALATNLRSLIAARLFLGLTSGSFPVAESYIVDALPPKERIQRMSDLGALSGIFFLFGPPIGSLVATITPLGLSGPFVFGAVVSFCVFAWSFTKILDQETLVDFVQRTPNYQARQRWKRLSEKYCPDMAAVIKKDSAQGSTNWSIVVVAMLGALVAAVITNVPAIVLAIGPMHHIGLNAQAFGMLLTMMGIVATAVRALFFTALQDAVGLHITGAIGGLSSVICELLWLQVGRGGGTSATAFDLFALIVGGLFNATGFMLAGAVISPIMASVAEASKVGFVIGLGASAQSAGRVVGPLLWGWIVEQLSTQIAFLAAAAIAAALGVMWVLTHVVVELWKARKHARIVVDMWIQRASPGASTIYDQIAAQTPLASDQSRAYELMEDVIHEEKAAVVHEEKSAVVPVRNDDPSC